MSKVKFDKNKTLLATFEYEVGTVLDTKVDAKFSDLVILYACMGAPIWFASRYVNSSFYGLPMSVDRYMFASFMIPRNSNGLHMGMLRERYGEINMIAYIDLSTNEIKTVEATFLEWAKLLGDYLD